MNKIPVPTNNNATAFQSLSMNHRVGSYPDLQLIAPSVYASYVQYLAVNGNPFLVQNYVLTQVQGDFLKQHYKSPPNDLAFITELRESTEHLVCPMCGSMHRGTLDHYLPKNTYAVFAIFSLNLVPACKCNSKRKEIVVGQNPGERILHPYFDNCLSERLITAKFSDLGRIPSVAVRLAVSASHPDHAAIDFHFRTVVKRTAICGYLADRWSKLCRKPSLVVRAFEHNIQSPIDLQHLLEVERQAQDDLHDGKNNWDSVFVSGLLDPPVMAWLIQQFSMPGRAANAPLAQ